MDVATYRLYRPKVKVRSQFWRQAFKVIGELSWDSKPPIIAVLYY